MLKQSSSKRSQGSEQGSNESLESKPISQLKFCFTREQNEAITKSMFPNYYFDGKTHQLFFFKALEKAFLTYAFL